MVEISSSFCTSLGITLELYALPECLTLYSIKIVCIYLSWKTKGHDIDSGNAVLVRLLSVKHDKYHKGSFMLVFLNDNLSDKI